MINVFVHIVDDDESMVYELGLVFTKNGIEYKIFTDPDEFLRTDDKKRICVIDYRFNNSGLTGFDVAEKVLEHNPRSNIIIITGYPNTTDLLKLMNLKAFKYISKVDPDFMDDLLKYVKQAIKLVHEEIILEEFASKRNIR